MTAAVCEGKGCRMERREQLNSNTVPGKASASPLLAPAERGSTDAPFLGEQDGQALTPPWTTADSLILEGGPAEASTEGANGCRLSDDSENKSHLEGDLASAFPSHHSLLHVLITDDVQQK